MVSFVLTFKFVWRQDTSAWPPKVVPTNLQCSAIGFDSECRRLLASVSRCYVEKSDSSTENFYNFPTAQTSIPRPAGEAVNLPEWFVGFFDGCALFHPWQMETSPGSLEFARLSPTIDWKTDLDHMSHRRKETSSRFFKLPKYQTNGAEAPLAGHTAVLWNVRRSFCLLPWSPRLCSGFDYHLLSWFCYL